MMRIGTAIGGTLADFSEFDRKSYFYPDIPKGYQISQYEHPLVSGGVLAGVPVTRVHLEEDTARSTHAGGKSLVDFNRAGVPLMELVTEPEIHDAETAGKFARELQLLLRTLGASEANLEKGEMRIEANISVSPDDTLGTKVEVKNLNSFRSVERAIRYEIDRQSQLIESGGTVVQETRGWDEGKQETFHQRLKEGSADYRYFPEPDLPKLVISDITAFAHEALVNELPELPWTRRDRYASLGVKAEDAEFIAGNEHNGFFDAVIAARPNSAVIAANYFLSDLGGDPKSVSPESFTALIAMVEENKVSSRGAKEVLAVMALEGGDPAEIAKAKGFEQVSDATALGKAVEAVIAANPGPAGEYRAGKEAALQYLVGQGMKETRGAGNPGVLRELFIEALKK